MPSIPVAVRHGAAVVLGLLLAACGGSDDGGTNMDTIAMTLSINPSTISAGQSVSVAWTSNGATCTPGGAWNSTAAQQPNGFAQIIPSGSGNQNITLSCTDPNKLPASSSAPITISAASAFTNTLLVANLTGGTARSVDPNLTNPWGVVFGPTTPVWLSNARSQTSTLYDGRGTVNPLVMTFTNADFAPTGIVWNGVATDFIVTSGGVSGSAGFIFDGKGGRIAGRAGAVNGGTVAVTMYSATDGANYKGLALAVNGTAQFLYAADFRNRKIDVFNNAYVKQTTSATAFTFNDPLIPATYAPFNVWALPTGAGGALQIWVAYAQRIAPANVDAQAGAGLGYVDVFDTNGQLLRQLVANGSLNAPWGLALAPANFGTLSGALLVGNFGDGRINGYDVTTGRFLGSVNNAAGTPYVFSGLWAIVFGNGAQNQPLNTLFYAAGINGEVNGNYGRIDLGTTPPSLGTAPTATITVPASPLRATVALTATATPTTAGAAIARVDYYYGTLSFTSIGSATTAPYTLNWNTTTVPNGSYSIRAVATDTLGNQGSSAATVATVTQ